MHDIYCISYFVAFFFFKNAGVALLKLAAHPLCRDPQFEKYYSIYEKSFPFHLSCVDMPSQELSQPFWKSKCSILYP